MLKFKIVDVRKSLAESASTYFYPNAMPTTTTPVDKTIVTLKLIDSDELDSPLTGASSNFIIEIPSIDDIGIDVGDVLELIKE